LSIDKNGYRNKIENFPDRRERIHEIIFEAETKEGKLFDVVLLGFILLSVLIVAIETIPSLSPRWGTTLFVLEWVFTIFFTIEYVLRIYCVYRPWKYITSFYGIVDLLSILPTYLSLFIPQANTLMVIRALRLMRVFRIFKLAAYTSQGAFIVAALKESRQKIVIFIFFIMLTISIFGSVMYVVEGGQNEAFASIPISIYWAIVTITTVGYGDISPITPLGQFLAAFVMIIGYAIIAVPTGIVTSELVKQTKVEDIRLESCRYCSKEGHDHDAIYCKYCAKALKLEDEEVEEL